ncbi:MAG: hypothetical protein AMXMBFR7_52000 [Planctomycetota bacterium]
MGRSALRRRLVAAYIRGGIDRSELFRRVRTAKAARAGRLKPGSRLRALLDLRRAVTGRLNQALKRLDADPEVWPREAQPKVQRLKAHLEQAHVALARTYTEAAKALRERR